MRVEFGDCLFDSGTRELFRAGKPAHLSPKSFRVLEILLERRPRALSKDELHGQVWPDTFVSEATLASAIAEIRAAIGDTGSKTRHLRTVHGFGYAFSGTVRESKPAPLEVGPRAFLVWEGRNIPLSEGENVLGRESDAGIRINDHSVSRRHARITIREGSAELEDLGSKNGTFLGPAKIQKPTPLKDGAEIHVGKVPLTFRLLADGPTETIAES